MPPSRHQQQFDLFTAASELAPAERRAFLEANCPDPELLAGVERLLAASESRSVLDRPAVDGLNVEPEAHSGGDAPDRGAATPAGYTPEQIGAYRIIRKLGVGTFAKVYLAEQDKTARQVALKVLHAGMDARSRRYFEMEGKVLAKLRHPFIARVFDAGTAVGDSGRHQYIAMEYIEGEVLNRAAEHLGLRQKLRLLTRICEAIEHAHQKGIVHRDLKPGNILVDRAGNPRVLDFGVARLTDSDIQTVTLKTDIGQLRGTVQYMSPEQASGDSSEVDTRSDVYALGIIMFELLSGQLPHDMESRSIPDALRAIREEPPARLADLEPDLPADLETIASKALAKDKSLRYQSASELAMDIDRFLRNEPILARPPSAWYELRKWMQRNRATVVLIGFIVALGVAVALGALYLALSAYAGAQAKLDEATERIRELESRFPPVDPAPAPRVTPTQGQPVAPGRGGGPAVR